MMVIAAYPVAHFFGNKQLIIPIIVMAFKFIALGLNIVQHALVLKNQKFRLVGRIELSTAIFSIILMILMAYFGFSYWSLIVPLVIAEILRSYLYFIVTPLKVKFYPLKYSIVAFRHAKSLIGSILGVRLISYWARNLDSILIGRSFGEASLGIYNRAYKFSELVSTLFERLFDTVLFPNLQKLREKGGEVFGEYVFFIGVMCFLSFPIGSLLIIFPENLVRILWGPDWMVVAEFLPYFGVAILCESAMSNTETLYKIFYKDLLLFKIGISRAILIVVFIIIGSMFSALMVARMVALVHIILVMPLIVYYSFGRELKVKYKLLHWLYLPRILLCTGIFISIWEDLFILTIIQLALYLIHLYLIHRKDVSKISDLLLKRFIVMKENKI